MALAGFLQPELDLVRLPSLEGARPQLAHAGQVVGMDHLLPAPSDHLVEGATEVLEHPLVHVVQRAVRPGGPHLIGNGICQEAIVALALGLCELSSRALALRLGDGRCSPVDERNEDDDAEQGNEQPGVRPRLSVSVEVRDHSDDCRQSDGEGNDPAPHGGALGELVSEPGHSPRYALAHRAISRGSCRASD